jgi:restriction endonuclease S subunit
MEDRDEMMAELEALKQRELQRLQKYREKLEKGKGKEEGKEEKSVPPPAETSPIGMESASTGRLLEYTPTAPYGSIFDDPASRPEDAVFIEKE